MGTNSIAWSEFLDLGAYFFNHSGSIRAWYNSWAEEWKWHNASQALLDHPQRLLNKDYLDKKKAAALPKWKIWKTRSEESTDINNLQILVESNELQPVASNNDDNDDKDDKDNKKDKEDREGEEDKEDKEEKEKKEQKEKKTRDKEQKGKQTVISSDIAGPSGESDSTKEKEVSRHSKPITAARQPVNVTFVTPPRGYRLPAMTARPTDSSTPLDTLITTLRDKK
ncbi:hypothetical protein N7528_009837 [Penicillium herquei]|nr:hypothetical protein N7528_009837 [Penicillium herquei]